MKPSLEVIIGKGKPPKGLASSMADDESSPDMHDDDIDVDEDEMDAAKLAYDAKSPEEYAKALKAFVHLCYLKHEDSEKEGY